MHFHDASDKQHTDELLREGQMPVLRYLLARVPDSAEAADLAQETLLRALRALSYGERPQRPLAWLLGIARNVLLEALRRRRYERQRRDLIARRYGADWASPWSEAWHQHLEARLLVDEAVDRLPDDLREPIVLHYFAELSVPAVAQHLSITPGAVKTRLWRARQLLRGDLERSMELNLPPPGVAIPLDLADRARAPSRQQPGYSSIQVALHVGGARYPIDPLSGPAFPEGAGLTLDNLRLAVDRLHALRLAGDRLLTERLGMWPAADPFEHAEPAAVWSLLRAAEIGEEAFQATGESRLVPTDGWRLGTDPNWRSVLNDLQQAGLRHVWFTLLGLEPTHDGLCSRPGAFAAIIAALERCAAVGLQTGANIVVSTRNVNEIGAIAERVRALGAERFVPAYVPSWSPLNALYETIRPQPEDLAGLPPAGMDVNWGYARFWADAESHTEGALTRLALQQTQSNNGGEEKPEARKRDLPLLVDANLDVFVGTPAAPPLMQIANLGSDKPADLYAKLLALEWPAPPDADLAAGYGDTESRKVHVDQSSVRRRWIAAWRAELNLNWLASY